MFILALQLVFFMPTVFCFMPVLYLLIISYIIYDVHCGYNCIFSLIYSCKRCQPTITEIGMESRL